MIVGERVPTAVEAYYAALDAGDFESAAEQLGEDVLIALPPRGGHEVDPRQLARGRAGARDLLVGRGPSGVRHQVILCMGQERSWYVEGVTRDPADDRPRRTFTGHFSLGEDGLIARYLAFACEPAVSMPPRADSARPADAASVVDAYFHAMDAADFEAAADCFSDDVLYCHPPYRHTNITSNLRHDFVGRAQLLSGFAARGKASFTHRVLELVQRGPNALFELVVENLPGGGTGSAVCSLSLNDQGRIHRYVAFYTEPGVEWM
ncbi:MAG TPA: nuclear transport factor 2 family protein [Candidatus Dormibacteraeota bacterium]